MKKKEILLGNEAIVRSALEAGVEFVSTYPGTPASEIGDSFARIANSQSPVAQNFYFEYGVNEKVALEAGIGASYSGLKTLVAMKHFGLNVCLDALLPFVYTGCVGPTLIVVADDPSCHSSVQSEQDTRAISYLAHIPTLEPSDPQECKDFVKLGFKISEKFKIPVMIRITTRVAHQRMPVKLNKINLLKSNLPGRLDFGTFKKDPKRFVSMPPSRTLEMKKQLLEKIEKIQKLAEVSKINVGYPISYTSRIQLGVITSGVSYLYVMEALKELNIKLPVLKLGFFYPLPETKIKKFIKGLDKVLIVEELEPWLEKEITRLAKDANPKLKIQGKDLLPIIGELNSDIVTGAVAKLVNKKYQVSSTKYQVPISKRWPRLCANCPYWLTFGAVKQALKQSKIKESDVIFGGDIGCYMLAGVEPINLQDYILCMGASIGIGHGIKKAAKNKQKLIAFIGDSTFFHAGIPGLINTVFNKSNPLIIIMDNQITAMTGQQPHPGQVIKIENIVKACGVENVKTIDPINQKLMINTIKQYLKNKQVSVIVASRPCVFLKK